MNAQNLFLSAPLDGTLLSIESSADPVFAQRLVGDGVVIEPSSEVLFAPCDGTISQLHDAGHAVVIKVTDDVELLMHIGIDTVTLKGIGFEPQVKIGQTVSQGQPLIEFSKSYIEEQGLSAQTVVLITSGQTMPELTYPRQIVANKDELFTLPLTQAKPSTDTVASTTDTSVSGEVIIKNPQGLHARPAAQLTAVAKHFNSVVTLTIPGTALSSLATSVTGIMGLQTKLNTTLLVTATGADAPAALTEIIAAIEAGLGEDVGQTEQADDDEFPEEPPLLSLDDATGNSLKGVKAAPGIAVGTIEYRHKELPSFPEQGININDETAQLNYAVSQAKQSLQQLVEKLAQNKLATQAEVFSAHLELLEDPAIINTAHANIQKGLSAAAAWHRAYSAEVKTLAAVESPLLRARASDIEDVGYRVMCNLLGIDDQTQSVVKNTVLVMKDITPSEVVSLDRKNVVGIITTGGGSTSHAAILAGSLNIPYLVNVSESITKQAAGTRVILNANKGNVVLNPSDDDVIAFNNLQQAQLDLLAQAKLAANKPAITTDGTVIEVAANVGSVEDAIAAAQAGADGIGLVRSEFLYLDRVSEPSLAEQTEVYHGILSGIGAHRSCIIRTLDVGGDKPLAYLPMAVEENPFLGERGIRVGLNRPHILRKQVRAIMNAASAGKPRIMFPMIASLEEFRAAKQLVLEEQKLAGVAAIEIGIMIEVPSAALLADQFAKEVDFFSIGTNDLTQYTLAMDRGHPKLAAQVDALHPAVLRLIAQTAKASIDQGKWTGICGSIASDVSAVPILIGLGVTELSTSTPMLALVKEKVRTLNLKECQQLAQAALAKATASEVRELLG